MLRFVSLLFLAALAHASTLTLQSPRFIVTSSTGNQLRSEPISLAQKTSVPVSLTQTDILKLTFQIVEKDSGNGVLPHQTFLRFYDEKSGEEGIQPIRVATSGKAKFELNMSKPPLSLPPTSTNPLKVSLIVGSSLHTPFTTELFDLTIPASHPPPQHPDEPSFHLLPEIHHTFRPAQKLPPKIISAFFSALVVSPWVVLLGLWSQVSPRPARLFSPSILPFISTLGAFEVLLVWYWVDLKLGQVLLYGAVLGLVTIFAGKQALASIGDRRVGRK
ncbi:Dolichyl-diphosphooligosaccharide--protein glycosyltransferase subunit Swp1 [Infundibulicybe gibba]|nr:Dolichyl-diphosphooligosaccharide--protein glycosyltransferase subunit Swp1 [Infundibulicybe gibba]